MLSSLLLLSLASCVVASYDLSHPSALPRDRILKAARRHEDLAKRSNEFFLTQDINLVYAEGENIDDDGQLFASQLQLKSKKPALFLEEFDHLLEEVDCSASTLTITVREAAVYTHARSVCHTLNETRGYVVSSHLSCSDEGAHTVFSIHDIAFHEDSLRITLRVISLPLAEAFSRKTFDLGRTAEAHIVHRHERLARRGLLNPPSPVLRRQEASPSATVTPDDTVNTASLNFSEINTTFKYPGTNESLPFDLGCRNCSGKGELTLSTVHFEFNDFDTIFNGTDDDLVKSGSVQIDLKGFEMSIGLKATPEAKLSQDITFFTYELIGVSIPAVGRVGLGFELALNLEAKLESAIELGFGFDVVVPDSVLRADIAETQDSKIDGFNPTVTAQVLRSNLSDVELTLSAGLKSSLPVGFSLLGFDMDLGPYLLLPNLELSATQLFTNETGANCESTGETDDKFKAQFANLTHVSYNVTVGGGIDFPLGIEIPFGETDLAQLATHCLVYQTEGPTTGLALATAALASIIAPPPEASASNTPAKKSSASRLIMLSGDFSSWIDQVVVAALFSLVASVVVL
ncbi:hypothetical protein BDV96DRAFT_560855 [Lophiotrema nucula]|uniref:GPI anchored protein n=1 Tax=Lophiotrema nucula TaxID=690887 RepID=A0A6A5ZSH2_9PLEO|nr:hypothetical protein BDV96DRAFT_560855 [Lophiotrema nucula]